MICPECDEEILDEGCWQCLGQPRLHPVLHRHQSFKEGVLCLRRVEITSAFAFQILYLRTWSNVVALEIAKARYPDAEIYCATPEAE
jgi:hypothetical protein